MKNRKYLIKAFSVLLLTLITQLVFAQSRNSLAVVSINSIKMPYESQQLTDVTRNAMEKLDLYYVIDKYDQISVAEQKNLDIKNCASKSCLVDLGKHLNAAFILTGSVENFGKKIIIKYRMINVQTQEIEKFKILEFLDLKDQIQPMIEITINDMYGGNYDKALYTKLSKENAFENTINTPEVEALNLSGPRMGVSVLLGEGAKVFSNPESEGGFDGFPVLTQFGYQFEIKYLNEGNFQALFEIIPSISGLEQGLFIPSVSLLNGLRSNKSGWEVGFGPQFLLSKKAEGYLNDNDVFILKNAGVVPEGQTLIKRADSRGDIALTTSFLIGIGKTFKSGTLNMPLNFFYKPGKDTHQFGISFGFNSGGLRRRK